ncbi:SIS8 [Symbiodinium sp. CCMP2456]|nr:SIS8 [Symbiodinium sp. CCMP2456]
MLAHGAAALWVCECGFRNRDSNVVCGGFGKLGCKKPRPSSQHEDLPQHPGRNLHADAVLTETPAGPALDVSPPDDLELKLLSLLQREPESQPPLHATDATDTKDSQILGNAAVQSLPSQSTPEMLEWTCQCGFRNRASNAVCGGTGRLGCGLPRPGSFQTPGAGSGSSPSPQPAKPAKPAKLQVAPVHAEATAEEPEKVAGSGSQATATATVPGGAWVCTSCGWRNQACNDVCGGVGRLGCKAPRSGRAEEPDVMPVQEKWTCQACGAENEADQITSCSSCSISRRLNGVVKSIGVDYGFISCPQTASAFGRDVYVSKQVLEAAFRKGRGASSGMSVSFIVWLNESGQPNASKVVPVEGGSVHEDTEFQGTVKYMSKEKGYGFIECKETFDLFSCDVYADLPVLNDCSLGQPVKFGIRLGQIGGRPQVRNLSTAGPPPEHLPATCSSLAQEVLSTAWAGPVLLLGEGDFTFAAAAATIHTESKLDATVVLEEDLWQERFPNHHKVVDALKELGHSIRFGVDAKQVDCANYSMIVFNFPAVSAQEVPRDDGGKLSASGELAFGFLMNARASADIGTLLVLGLWGRCDGGADARLYGQDCHELVAAALTRDGARCLEDALPGGYSRSGVYADYGFYHAYEQEGYSFRTNCIASFESSHKEWHLQACFILRVVAAAATDVEKGFVSLPYMARGGACSWRSRAKEKLVEETLKRRPLGGPKDWAKDAGAEDGESGELGKVTSSEPVQLRSVAAKDVVDATPETQPPSRTVSPTQPARHHAVNGIWFVVVCFIILDALKPILVTWANQSHAEGEPGFIRGTFVLVQTALSLLVGLCIAVQPSLSLSRPHFRLHPFWRSRVRRCLSMKVVVRQLPVSVCLCLSKLLLVYALGRLDAGTVRVFGQASLPLVGVSSALFFNRRYSLQQWCSLMAVSLGLITFYYVKAKFPPLAMLESATRLSQLFFEEGKLDVSNRLDDGFREAGADMDPLAPGVECLLVDRNEDEPLQQFVERCRKKLRKAKDEAAQAMVLALLVSDACGRSGVHASDLQARHAELVAGQRRTTGVVLLGDLLGEVAASPARNSRSRSGAALSERAILFKAVADWLGTFCCTLQRQQNALFNVVNISQMPCVVDLLFDPGGHATIFKDGPQRPDATASLARRIGRGGFGEVFHGRWAGVRVAVKEMKDSSRAPSDADVVEFLLEIAMLSQLNHPNIVRFWRGSTEMHSGSRSLLMVTEYIKQGGLSRLLHGHGGPALPDPLTLGQSLSFALDVARGVQYLHGQRILHLDLKSPNVLCAPVWTAKLCDFGLAKMRGEATYVQSTLQGVSPVWAPPEMFDSKSGGLTEKADVYSFAVIFFELLTKQVPFAEVSSAKLPAAKAAGQLPRIPNSVPADCADLILQCCAANLLGRPSMSGAAARVREIAQSHEIQLAEVKPPAALLRFDDDQERRVQEAEDAAAQTLIDVDKQRAHLRMELSELHRQIEIARKRQATEAAEAPKNSASPSREDAAGTGTTPDDSWCDPFVQEVAGAKFRCALCSKLFRGPEFVKRHLEAKHRDEAKRLIEDKYFDCDVSREDALPVHHAVGTAVGRKGLGWVSP